MQYIIDILAWLDGYISVHPVFIYTLLGTGVFLTVYLGFPQVRYFGKACRTLRGHYDKNHHEGDASHFQALSTALSGTVGTGNIAGVAMAIHLGGPAALFWMVVTALIGMATKFSEVTLSHKYREKLPDGTMAGGPMFYMDKRLNIKIKSRTIKTGHFIAVVFAASTVLCAFSTGCLPQINNIATAMRDTFSIPQIVCGALLAVALAAVVLGGIKRIVTVTEKIVPFMAVVYFAGATVVILCHIENLWPGLKSVFGDVFTGTAATGGFLGGTVSLAMSRGINRGLFSNEAGQGSAPIAHATARCQFPAQEGLVSMLEPFIDTVIICSLTGLMIVSTGVWSQKFYNDFQQADIIVVNTVSNDAGELSEAMQNESLHFDGVIEVVDGKAKAGNWTLIHAQSVAEDMFFTLGGKPFSGNINISKGKPVLESGIKITGKSLLHSAPLTIKAFSSSWFGSFGEYIVALSLLLFAFSTSIAWCYYGDRAMIFMFGQKSVLPFRIIYVIGFFIASFSDTSVIWYISSVGVVLMAMPNLIGLLILHKELKSETENLNTL
jgi:AGCS family alanine or glycine:cation symporter